MITVETSLRALQLEVDTLFGLSADENVSPAFILGAMTALKWIAEGTTKPSEILEHRDG